MSNFIGKFKAILAKSSLTRGAFYLMGSSSIGHAIAVLTFPILSRIYSPAEIGVWGMFSSMMALVVVSVNLKFDMAIVTEADDHDAGVLFWMSLLIGSLMALVFTLLFAGLIHFHVLAYGKFDRTSISIMLFAALVIAVFQPVWNYYLRRSNYKKLGVIHLTQKIGRLSTQIGLGLLTNGYVGLLFSEVLGRLLAVLYSAPAIAKQLLDSLWRIQFSQMKTMVLKRLDFPKFILPATIISVLASIAAVPLLSFYFSAHEAGLYAIVYKILSLPVAILSNTMADVFYNEAAKQKRDDPKNVRTLFISTTKKLFLFALMPLIVIELLSPYLFTTFLGSNWAGCGVVAQVLAPWLFLFTIVNSVNRIAIVIDKQWAKLGYDVCNFVAVCGGIIVGHDLHFSFLGSLTLMSVLCLFVNVVFLILFYYLVENYLPLEVNHDYSISHSHD